MKNQIDYKSPTNQIDDILFDVKLQTVQSTFKFPETNNAQLIPAPNYRAVVNQSNGNVISVVGKNYRLITNADAIKMGKEIFAMLYPDKNVDKLIPYKVVAPSSLASAHIDLIHEDVNFNMWEQETWLPFLRVSNSYNRTYALSFEIGFVRKLCSNGVLFNKKTMKLKYVHNSKKMNSALNDATQIGTNSKLFTEQCAKLREFELKKELLFPLVCQIMKLNLDLPDERNWKKKRNNLDNLSNIVQTLTSRYNNEFGLNAYAAFNVATDLVSHQQEYKNLTGFYFNIRSFYTRPTDWTEDFIIERRNNDFSMDKYLEQTINKLDDLKKKLGFRWELN